MENGQTPNYSTQKEEPVNIPEKPKTMGTPTHPLPKFLPKPIALIVIILIVGVLLSGLVFTVYSLGRNSIATKAVIVPSPTPIVYSNPTSTPINKENQVATARFDPESSATISSIILPQFGISFKLPSSYTKITDTPESVTFGIQYKNGEKDELLTISNKRTINVNDYTSCLLVKKETKVAPTCIRSVSYGAQDEEIKNIAIDHKKAISYIMFFGSDTDTHYIQLDENPYLEFKMYIAGGGLEKTFTNFLNSITFIN